jgi:thiamine phosphate synthase YjbQ (UPF0047 family)
MLCDVFHRRNVLIAHITASVFINDDERGLHADGRKPSAFSLGIARNPQWLEELAPHEPISRYRHNRTGEACPGQRTGTTATPT